jgi:calcineurin-like phosphoesterase family protein
MNYKLIQNINSVCKSDDILYHLGDFSFYQKERNHAILKSINANVVLVRGNHDQGNRVKGLNFADVFDELDLILGNHLVTLSHYPFWLSDSTYFKYNPKEESQPDRFPEKRPKDVGQWLLHGHSHSKKRIDREYRMIHVGVDANNHTPLDENTILRLIEGDL